MSFAFETRQYCAGWRKFGTLTILSREISLSSSKQRQKTIEALHRKFFFIGATETLPVILFQKVFFTFCVFLALLLYISFLIIVE